VDTSGRSPFQNGLRRRRQLDPWCRHQSRYVATVYQQGGPNLGTRLYAEGDLGDCESKREKLRSANGRSARFATDLCAAVPSGRRRAGADPVSVRQTTERYLGCKQRFRNAADLSLPIRSGDHLDYFGSPTNREYQSSSRVGGSRYFNGEKSVGRMYVTSALSSVFSVCSDLRIS
jgi:hypothetical protein